MSEIDYKAEVLKHYTLNFDLGCEFYFDKKAQEKLWHIDVIDLDNKRMKNIGKGLFAKDAWKNAYELLNTNKFK